MSQGGGVGGRGYFDIIFLCCRETLSITREISMSQLVLCEIVGPIMVRFSLDVYTMMTMQLESIIILL